MFGSGNNPEGIIHKLLEKHRKIFFIFLTSFFRTYTPCTLLTITKHSEDCTAVLSEYSNLRCRALAKLHHHGNGGIGEFKRNDGEKKNDPEDSATAREAERSIPPRPRVSFWAAEVREREREGEQEEDSADDLDHLDRKRSKLIALRDAVMLGTSKGLRAPPRRGEEGFDVETVEPPTAESQSQQHQRRWRHTRRGEDDEQPPGLSDPEPVDIRHSWTVHSQEGCHIGEVRLVVAGGLILIDRSWCVICCCEFRPKCSQFRVRYIAPSWKTFARICVCMAQCSVHFLGLFSIFFSVPQDARDFVSQEMLLSPPPSVLVAVTWPGNLNLLRAIWHAGETVR